MKKLSILIFLIFFLSSCSSFKTGSQPAQKSNGVNPDQVDLSIDSSTDKAEVLPVEETVRVGDRGGDVYSNTATGGEHERPETKKLRIGLSFGPGIYRTINYVSFLKILERQNLSPDIITGTGLGAIVAAMYAIGMTPEVIEWNFYKYFKERRKSKPYDSEWIAEIDGAFLKKFKTLNIQDTKKRFFITLYDRITKKTYYFDKGNIRDLLLLNLRLSNNYTGLKQGQKYSAAFEKEVFNARLLRQLGAEFTIAVDSLGATFDFENPNEFLIGVYSGVAGRIQKEKKDFDYSVTLPLNTMNLDSTKDGPLYLQRSYEFMQKQSPIIVKKIHAKQESLVNSGNE
ncbi:MAG: patatin-like phospholipase family protein [Bacteriovorax sp.]|jgi:hypothetical protein